MHLFVFLQLPRWAAYFHENPWENYEIGCLSFEDGEEVDASEATWLCKSRTERGHRLELVGSVLAYFVGANGPPRLTMQ